MTDKWHLRGNYFESCTCDLVCPCIFLKSPTKGYCKAMVGWQITDGQMNDTDLSGLNVALYLNAPSDLTDGGWRVALYIDARSDDAQKDALTKIYSGEVGGHLAVVAGFFGEVMGIHTANIDIRYTDSEKQMDIEGVGQMKTKAVEGADGGQVTVSNNPLAVAPGYPIVVHETESLSYNHEEEHSHKGTVALASPFSYQP